MEKLFLQVLFLSRKSLQRWKPFSEGCQFLPTLPCSRMVLQVIGMMVFLFIQGLLLPPATTRPRSHHSLCLGTRIRSRRQWAQGSQVSDYPTLRYLILLPCNENLHPLLTSMPTLSRHQDKETCLFVALLQRMLRAMCPDVRLIYPRLLDGRQYPSPSSVPLGKSCAKTQGQFAGLWQHRHFRRRPLFSPARRVRCILFIYLLTTRRHRGLSKPYVTRSTLGTVRCQNFICTDLVIVLVHISLSTCLGFPSSVIPLSLCSYLCWCWNF